jgi:hypothetical protein
MLLEKVKMFSLRRRNLKRLNRYLASAQGSNTERLLIAAAMTELEDENVQKSQVNYQQKNERYF